MRLRALQELKYKEIPDSWVMLADEWSEEKRKEFTIKDNVSFGEWDWDTLANEWNFEELTEWGLDIPNFEKIDNLKEGDVFEDLRVKQSVQVLPKNEYIIIIAPEDSDEWAELKTIFKCETVRSGGCKIGSTSDKVGMGTERVFTLKTFKERVGL